MHFIRSQYDSVIVQAMMEFFVSHKNTNKGGEVMDSGASSYHICGSIDKNKIMRGNYHGQRYFYKASGAARIQSCQKYSRCNERSGHSLSSLNFK